MVVLENMYMKQVCPTVAHTTRAGCMPQQVKVPASQDWHLEFDPWNSCRSERRKLTKLSSDRQMCTVCLCIHIL